MEKRIKIFTTHDNPNDLERAVNLWLEKHRDITIVNIMTSHAADANLGFSFSIVVLYETMRKINDAIPETGRHHDRIDLFEIVDYTVEGRYYRDFVEDISESGLFIRTQRSFRTGQEIQLSFMAPNLERPLKIKGEIARSLPEGIGVKFLKESQVQEDMIRALIQNVTKP